MESVIVRFRSLHFYNQRIPRTIEIVDMVLADNGPNVAAAKEKTSFSPHGTPRNAAIESVLDTDRGSETVDHGGHGAEILSTYHVGQSCAINVCATQRLKNKQ